MNARQQRIIEDLRRDIIENDGHGNQYEYKQFEVKEEPPHTTVFVYSEVGRKGDEDTLASLLCRTIRHIAIGPKGSIRLLNPGRYSKATKGITWKKGYVRGYRNALISLTK